MAISSQPTVVNNFPVQKIEGCSDQVEQWSIIIQIAVIIFTGSGVHLKQCLKREGTINKSLTLQRKLYMAALVIFLAFSFSLPPIVKADDLPPVDPTAEDELLPPPVDTPVSNPSLDDWVTWPIEEPGIVRPIKEPTGSIHIKIHHKDTTDGDNDSTGYIPEVNYSQFEQQFAALAVNNRSSDAAYNSLVGCNPNIKERIAANIIIDPED